MISSAQANAPECASTICGQFPLLGMQLTPRVSFWVGKSPSPTLLLRHHEEEDVDGRGGPLYATLKRRKMAMTAAALKAIALGGIMFIMVGIGPYEGVGKRMKVAEIQPIMIALFSLMIES